MEISETTLVPATPKRINPLIPISGVIALIVLAGGAYYFTQPQPSSGTQLTYRITVPSQSGDFSERGLLQTRFELRTEFATAEGLPGQIKLNYGLACKRVGEARTEVVNETRSARVVELDCLSPDPMTAENDPGDWFAYVYVIEN